MKSIYEEMREVGLSPVNTPAMWATALRLWQKLKHCPCETHANLLEKITRIHIDGDWKDYGKDQYFPTGMGSEGMFKGEPI